MTSEFPYICEIEDPDLHAFSYEDEQKLKKIGLGLEPIKEVTINDTWIDDHEQCVSLAVNGIQFSAMWICVEFYADIVCAKRGDEAGKEALVEYIADYTETVKYDE